jgi:hypothetical protein
MYRQIGDFAPEVDNAYSRDPLLYCVLDPMDSQFIHGSSGRTFGKYNRHCSEFLTQRCAENWDEVCEAISKDKEGRFPDEAAALSAPNGYGAAAAPCLPYGQMIIRQSAFKKFRVQTNDCNVKCEPFDPTVANSPMVCYETRQACAATSARTTDVCLGVSEAGECRGVYKILPAQALQLDSDPVMNKILDQPHIAMDLLEAIYGEMRTDGTLGLLRNTRLGKFYEYLGHPV